MTKQAQAIRKQTKITKAQREALSKWVTKAKKEMDELFQEYDHPNWKEKLKTHMEKIKKKGK